MAEYTVFVDEREIKRAARVLRVKADERFAAVVRPLLVRRLAEGERAIKYNLTGPVLRRRSGNLVRAVGFVVFEQGRDTVFGRLGVLQEGPAQAYAGIHMRGGVIRPKRGHYLAIPLPAAQTPAGVTRFSPREVVGGFFIRSKNGNLLLVQKVAGGIRPLFVMKTQVTLPRRDYFSGPRDATFARIREDLAQVLRNKLEIAQ